MSSTENGFTVRLDDFKHLDHSRLEKLDEKHAQNFARSFLPSIGSVLYLSGFTETGKTIYDFPFNDNGIEWVERYLDTMVKPNILKWDANCNPIRVKPWEVDLKGSKKQQVLWFTMRINMASILLGQCLAQQHGLWWTEDGRALRDEETGEIIKTQYKCAKYTRLGREDSLRAYSKAISRRVGNAMMLKKAQEVAEQKGELPPAKHRMYRCFHTEDGHLRDLHIIDTRTDKIVHRAMFCVAQVQEAANG